MNDVRFPAAKEQANGRLNIPRGRNGMQGLIVWHRRLGIATAVIVLLLAVTGLLLNHTHRLGLDRTQVTANWLLRWYGFPRVEKPVSYRAGERWISWTGARLYLEDTQVAETASAPIGAAAVANDRLAVAFPDMLLLLGANGEVVERIGDESLPGKLDRIGISGGGQVVVATAQGRFGADVNLIEWQPTSVQPEWSSPQEAPAGLRKQLSTAQRGPGLSAERVLLDLHSGRLFGAWGPWLMDAAAIVFVILAITGISYWWNRRGRSPGFSPQNGDRKNGE